MSRETETARLRACRELFERAMRDKVSMQVARERIAAEAKQEQLAQIRRKDERIADMGGRRSMQPAQSPTFWWQQGDMA